MARPLDFAGLVRLCRATHEGLQGHAVRAADKYLVVRNWLFGYYIVEYEQDGADRARYGSRYLATLSKRLRQQGIEGSSQTSLRLYRAFYQQHKGIRPTVSGELRRQRGQTATLGFGQQGRTSPPRASPTSCSFLTMCSLRWQNTSHSDGLTTSFS